VQLSRPLLDNGSVANTVPHVVQAQQHHSVLTARFLLLLKPLLHLLLLHSLLLLVL
jgi:hypothetical protein